MSSEAKVSQPDSAFDLQVTRLMTPDPIADWQLSVGQYLYHAPDTMRAGKQPRGGNDKHSHSIDHEC